MGAARRSGARSAAFPVTVSRETSVENVMRFVLHSRRLPPLTDALALGELARANALRRADGRGQEVVRRLRGRSQDGLVDGHRHCHFISTDEDGDEHLDHLTVWCPDGLGDEEREVLATPLLRSWWLGDHRIELEVVDAHDGGETPGFLSKSDRWVSHTPFLPVRHRKATTSEVRDGYEVQVQLELNRRGLPTAASIIVESTGAAARRWNQFRRERHHGAPRRDIPALGVHLHFPEPLDGPIALGRFSHFGMGVFLPRI